MSLQIDLFSVDVGQLRNPDFQRFLDHWQALAGQRRAPSWEEFDLMQLPPKVVPFVAVVDVVGAREDFVYRFFGTGHTQVKGVDYTGQSVRNHQPPEFAEAIYKEYDAVAAKMEPMAFVHDIREAHGVVSKLQESLRLPLSSDGESVDKIVAFSDWRTEADDWRKFYERLPD